VHSNPLLIAVAVAILGGVLITPMGRWTQWSWPEGEVVPLADDVPATVAPRESDEDRVAVQNAPTGDLSPKAAT
jgi:hypothetical protein